MPIVHMAVQDIAPGEQNTASVALMLWWSLTVIMRMACQTGARFVHPRTAFAGEHDGLLSSGITMPDAKLIRSAGGGCGRRVVRDPLAPKKLRE